MRQGADLRARAPGRSLRVVLVAFYNYQSQELRIFQPLLRQRGHEVHAIFFKNHFTYHEPTATDEKLVVDLIAQIPLQSHADNRPFNQPMGSPAQQP